MTEEKQNNVLSVQDRELQASTLEQESMQEQPISRGLSTLAGGVGGCFAGMVVGACFDSAGGGYALTVMGAIGGALSGAFLGYFLNDGKNNAQDNGYVEASMQDK